MGTSLAVQPDVARVPSSRGADQAAPHTLGRRLGTTLLALTVVLGAALRLRQYLFGRSFWYDELFLATNVRDRSLLGLTHPLIFEQAAPLGFLWSAKASISAFGQSEAGYRLMPLLAGIVTVACVAAVSRRMFTMPAAIAATGMVALADQSIHYSSEFKQYTTEAAVAAALLLVASHCLGRTLADTPRHPVLLALAGAAAMIFSISAIFVLSGIAIVLVVQVVRSRHRDRYVSAFWIALAWSAAAVGMYLVTWSPDRHNRSLHDYWSAYYGPTLWRHPEWYVSSWTAMIKAQVAISWFWAALVLTVVGLGWLARRAPTIAIIAGTTIASTVAASWASVYPFGGRLLLFLVPTVCVVFGATVDAVATVGARIHPRAGSLMACAVAVLLVSGSLDIAWTRAAHPFADEEMRELLEAVRPRFRPGDRLVVANDAALAFGFYEQRTGFADVAAVLQRADPDPARIPAFLHQIDALGPGRTWILYSRLHPGTVYVGEADDVDAHVDGRIIRVIRESGVMAVEIDSSR